MVGHVYVNDNTAGTNTIGAFDRHAGETLTPAAGSRSRPAPEPGPGWPPRVRCRSRRDGRFLIAAEAASNQISVLRISPDGSLRLVPGGVVSSGGVLPVSVAIPDDLVYVANSGNGGSNYAGFRLGPDGRLEQIAGSAAALPDGSQPGDVLFNGDGTKLAGMRVGTSLIDSFTVGNNGRLTAAPGSPSPAQGLGPSGSEFRPANPDQVFVSNAHNGAAAGPSRQRLRRRDAVADRILPVRRPADSPVLGGDQPRRPFPVHREHPIRLHLPVCDQLRWRVDAAGQHAGRRHRRRRPRAARGACRSGRS